MTSRQKIAIDKFVEKQGKTTVAEVMREAAYDEHTIKNPSNLTESKAWKEMIEDKLPDSELLEVHRKGLYATKPIGASILVDKNGRVVKAEEQGVIEVEDHPTQLKALELAYKIKRKFIEGEGGDKTINFFNLNDEQLERIITGRQT